MERESFASINTPERRIEMTAGNTSVYLHLGVLSVYDHLFTIYKDGDTDKGIYLWRFHEKFETVKNDAIEAGCEIHANLRQASDADQRNYMALAMADMGDTIPEEWLDGES